MKLASLVVRMASLVVQSLQLKFGHRTSFPKLKVESIMRKKKSGFTCQS